MNFKSTVIKDLNFRKNTYLNSNSIKTIKKEDNKQDNIKAANFYTDNQAVFSLTGNSIKEGFGSNTNKKDDDIMAIINRKLQGLTQELGGSSGTKEVKSILTNTKKICDLECAKCMMSMLESTKGIKAIDLDKLVDDDSSDNCIKCKKYTELSTSIKSMIDSL